MNDIFEIKKAYQDDSVLRESFNLLAKEIHGIDFEDWYQNGFWTKDYIPYSVVCNHKVIANISVSPMTFRYKEKEYHFLQFGTVMTKENQRNKGFIRKLIHEIEKDFENKADGYFLFANESVLDFYPKFGYRKTNEYFYFKKYEDTFGEKQEVKNGNKIESTCNEENQTLQIKVQKRIHSQKLIKKSAFDENGIKELKSMLLNSKENAIFSLQNKDNLAMFYLTKYMQNDIYFSKSQSAYIIAEILEKQLHVYAVYSEKNADLHVILDEFRMEYPVIEEVILGFIPYISTGFETRIGKEDGVTLFTKGEFFDLFESDKLRISILSHT